MAKQTIPNIITCRFCEDEVVLTPTKPGRINVCTDPGCQRRDRLEAQEPEKLKGWTAWEGKHTPVLTITSARKADNINAMMRRHGHNASLPGVGGYSYAQDCHAMEQTGARRERTAEEQEQHELKADRR